MIRTVVVGWCGWVTTGRCTSGVVRPNITLSAINDQLSGIDEVHPDYCWNVVVQGVEGMTECVLADGDHEVVRSF